MRAIFAVALILWTTAATAADLSSLKVRQGETVASLAELTGDGPRLVHLWATWCAPCRVELPHLAEAMAENRALGEGIILLSVDTAPAERVADFLADLGVAVPYWQVADGNAGEALGVFGYPTTLTLVGGAIVNQHTGVMDWRDPQVIESVENALAQ